MLDKYKAGLQDIFNENAKAVNEANKKYIKAYFEQFKTMPNLEFLNIRYELSDFTMNGDYKFKLISFGYSYINDIEREKMLIENLTEVDIKNICESKIF